MMDIRLLEASDDMEALTEMLHRAYRELLEMGLHFTATRQTVETTRLRASEGECWVAVEEGMIIGTITWVKGHPAHDVAYYQRPQLAYFTQFGVDTNARGRGIGRELLFLVESRAASSGHSEMALDTSIQATHLIELYARYGYEIVDEHQWESVNYLSVIMAKNLGRQTHR